MGSCFPTLARKLRKDGAPMVQAAQDEEQKRILRDAYPTARGRATGPQACVAQDDTVIGGPRWDG